MSYMELPKNLNMLIDIASGDPTTAQHVIIKLLESLDDRSADGVQRIKSIAERLNLIFFKNAFSELEEKVIAGEDECMDCAVQTLIGDICIYILDITPKSLHRIIAFNLSGYLDEEYEFGEISNDIEERIHQLKTENSSESPGADEPPSNFKPSNN